MSRNGIALLVPAVAIAALISAVLGVLPADVLNPFSSADAYYPDETTPVIVVGSANGDVGDKVIVELDALNMASPGLGAWTIDVVYDPNIVSVSGCVAQQGGVCNEFFDTDTVRVTGASSTGLTGDTKLAAISFTCESLGSSKLGIDTEVLADATVGDPQPIEAKIVQGEIACKPAPAISITSEKTEVGEKVVVELVALNMPEPGLGAWTIDVNYDPSVITAVDCDAQAGGVCNPSFDGDTVRVAGADSPGLPGDTKLLTISFVCKLEGLSKLAIKIDTLTIGFSPIEPDVEQGEVDCNPGPTPTAEPTATPTPVEVKVGINTSGGGALVGYAGTISVGGSKGQLVIVTVNFSTKLPSATYAVLLTNVDQSCLPLHVVSKTANGFVFRACGGHLVDWAVLMPRQRGLGPN